MKVSSVIARLSQLAAVVLLIPFSLMHDTNAQISIGNGESNWIKIETMKRDGNTLIIDEITIDGDGWLVIHPFENGAPNGDRVVGRQFLKSGVNRNVSIEVYKGLEAGEMMIVMLHRDSNDNGEFDFIFVDAQNVMDRAVFEGNTMIGHAVPAP